MYGCNASKTLIIIWPGENRSSFAQCHPSSPFKSQPGRCSKMILSRVHTSCETHMICEKTGWVWQDRDMKIHEHTLYIYIYVYICIYLGHLPNVHLASKVFLPQYSIWRLRPVGASRCGQRSLSDPAAKLAVGDRRGLRCVGHLLEAITRIKHPDIRFLFVPFKIWSLLILKPLNFLSSILPSHKQCKS